MNYQLCCFVAVSNLLACTARAQTPPTIDYNGRVTVDGQNFTSTDEAPGFFKCILVTGAGETIWSNDGTGGAPEGSSSNGSEPTGSAGPPPVPAAIELVDGSSSAPFANQGQFTLRLGAGTMPPITPGVLTDSGGNVRSDVRLRVWFSADNSVFQQLTPDVQLGAVPFSLWAASAETVKDRAITTDKLANGAVTAGKLGPGSVTGAAIEDATITTEKLEDGAVTAAKMRTALLQGGWAEVDPGDVTIDLGVGTMTASLSFAEEFGGVPLIEAPGWTVTSTSPGGFTAQRPASFLSQIVDAGTVGARRTSLAMVNGRPAIAYKDEAFDRLKYVVASDPAGTAWGEPATWAGIGPFSPYPSLAVIGGKPAISYVTRTDQGFVLMYLSAEDPGGAQWSAPVTVFDGLPEHTSLTTVDGRPAISFVNNEAPIKQLKYVIADDAGGSAWGTSVSIGDWGEFNSLIVVNGRPAIGYLDAVSRALKYARAMDATGSTWETPRAVDNSGGAGLAASMAIIAGHPAIAYSDLVLGQLRYLRADDPDGAEWGDAVTVLDGVGAFISLAVVDGHPAVAFRDENGTPQFVRAADATGATWGTAISVGPPGIEARALSMVEVDGEPALSYQAGPGTDLRFARLETNAGAGQWIATDPSQNPGIRVRASGVLDRSVTTSSLIEGAVTPGKIAWEYAIFAEQVFDGSPAGPSLSDRFQIRALNHVVAVIPEEGGSISLENPVITLKHGVYHVRGSAPGYRTGRTAAHFVRFDGTLGLPEETVMSGEATRSPHGGDNSVVRSAFEGIVEVSGSEEQFVVLQYTEASVGTDGLGIAVLDGQPEIYTKVTIQKLR